MVLVVNDGQWREWKSSPTLAECEELVQVLIKHREDKIKAYCLAREVQK